MSANGPINYGYFNYSQGNYIQRVDYDANGNAIYLGWATPGTLSSEPKWRIVQNTYDGSGRFIQSGFALSSPAFIHIWDNRASITSYQ